MKPWPKNNDLIPFEESLNAIRKSVDHAIGVDRPSDPLPYEGYDIGERDKAVVPSPNWTFTKEGKAYHHEQGRDVVDMALATAFQLGMEQGRRIIKKELKIPLVVLKLVRGNKLDSAELKSAIEMLQEMVKE